MFDFKIRCFEEKCINVKDTLILTAIKYSLKGINF